MKIIYFFITTLVTRVLSGDECYDDKNQVIYFQTCSSSLFDVRLSEINEYDYGVGIKVTFNLALLCDFDVFEIMLNIDDNASAKNYCGNKENNEDWRIHSKKLYRRGNNSEYKLCMETAEIKFPNLFSGCYKVDIIGWSNNFQIPRHNLGLVPKISRTAYFSFNHEVINISVVNSVYRDNDRSYHFDLKIRNKFVNKEIDLQFEIQSNEKKLSSWRMKCLLDSPGKCTFVSQQNVIVICNNVIADMPTIECTLLDIEGNYSLQIKLKNDKRCDLRNNPRYTNHPCEFSVRNIEAFSNRTGVNLEKPKSDSTVVLVVIITSLVVLAACIPIIIYVRRSRNLTDDSVQYTTINRHQPVDNNFDIFLVYARDCEIIMEAMSVLRILLEELVPCNKVYDIYDSKYSSEVSRGPQDWVFRHLSRPPGRFKVLLVASDCGHILLQRSNVHYRQPHFCDDLFPFAFRLVANTRIPSHESLFVLNFNADNPRQHGSFVCLTQGRRFVMPDSLSELLKLLGAEDTDVKSSENIEVFHEKCEQFRTFVKNYPSYIADILNVQVENGNQSLIA